MTKQTREQLGVKAGDSIIIKGTVAFARLDKLVEGDALARENERRAKMGMLHTKPFRSITIEDPEIVKGQGSPLAMFHGQSVYVSKTTGKQTMSFESKSLFAPQYGHIQNGKIVEIADPMRNPAQGQVVYLMITAYAPKGFNNLGSTFDAIVFEEGPIRFYEGNNSLAGFGAALNMPVEPLPQVQPEPVQPDNQGFANAPVNEPVANPNANPFGGNAGNAGQGQPTPDANPFGAGAGQPANNPFAQGGQSAPASNPFGIQDGDLNQGQGQPNPFGNAGNSGQRANSPFA